MGASRKRLGHFRSTTPVQTVFFDSQNEMYLQYYELFFAPYHHTAGATNCDHQTEISAVYYSNASNLKNLRQRYENRI